MKHYTFGGTFCKYATPIGVINNPESGMIAAIAVKTTLAVVRPISANVRYVEATAYT
jgi:hypothetical protein